MFDSLFAHFDHILTFDTETTGFHPPADEMIEFGGVTLKRGQSLKEAVPLEFLIRRSAGARPLDKKIVALTHITEADLKRDGIDKRSAAEKVASFFDVEKPLVTAYNAQFDLLFVYHLLRPFKLEQVLKKAHFLDTLTVYRDRKPKPHKLEDALAYFHLTDEVNSHRADDDAKAALAVLQKLDDEHDDLAYYVDIFGYIGAMPKQQIAIVDYKTHAVDRRIYNL